MQAHRQLTLAFAILLCLHLVSSLAAITLLGRMAPAIEGILEDNVASLQSVEEMMACSLRVHLSSEDPEALQREFEAAFTRARASVSEDAEAPVLERIAVEAPAAFRGEAEATRRLNADLVALGQINRDAMAQADRSAKRLGIAGAWAMVILGVLGFMIGVLVMGRMRRHILEPVREIFEVLRAVTTGNIYRRCSPSVAPNTEFTQAMTMVNSLLDRRANDSAQLASALFDQTPQPLVLLSSTGRLLSANAAAVEALSGPRGAELRENFTSILQAGASERGRPASLQPLGPDCWLYRFEPA